MEDDIIKIFVVNLERSEGRRQEIMKKLTHAGISFEIYKAVDGKNISEDVMEEIHSKGEFFRELYGRKMKKEEAGCAISHIGLYKKIVLERIGMAIILEDDIEFDHRLKHITQNKKLIEKVLERYDLILLGYAEGDLNYLKGGNCSYWHRMNLDKIIRVGTPIHRCWTTIGYLLSLKGATKLLSDGDVPSVQADLLTSNSPLLDVKLGIMRKQIVWPNELSEISIIGDRTFYPQSITAVKETSISKFKKLLLLVNQVIPIKRGYYFILNFVGPINKKITLFKLKFSPKLYGYVEEVEV